MTRNSLKWFKIGAAFLWVAVILCGGWWFHGAGISWQEFPGIAKQTVVAYGLWGPVVLLALHLFRTVLFLPITVLLLLAGSLYGPVWGSVINIVGENISAGCSFFLARFFGRSFVAEQEEGWVRKYDVVMSKEGFLTVITMRLLGFPFDVVNVLAGLAGVSFRQFIIATFFGALPSTITITVLGDAFGNPKAFLLFGCLLAATIAIVVGLRRSKWVKEKLYAKETV